MIIIPTIIAGFFILMLSIEFIKQVVFGEMTLQQFNKYFGEKIK